MALTGEVKRQDGLRFLQVLRLQRSAGKSLVAAVTPWSPTMGLLLGSSIPRATAAAVWEGRRAVGVAQMAPQSGRDRWEVMYLAVAGADAYASDGTNDCPHLALLLDEVSRLAGAKRITGIVARVPSESSLLPTFQRAGYVATMQEFVYELSSPLAVAAPAIEGLRLQERGDAWSLHQLYMRSTPQVVRLAEGRTARDWQLRRGLSRLSLKATRWVVDDAEGLQGWLTEVPGRGGELAIQLGVAPGKADLARDLLASALGRAGDYRTARVRSRVPAYATDLQQAFADFGFSRLACDLVLTRSLAIRARDFVPFRSGRGEAREQLAPSQSKAISIRSG